MTDFDLVIDACRRKDEAEKQKQSVMGYRKQQPGSTGQQAKQVNPLLADAERRARAAQKGNAA